MGAVAVELDEEVASLLRQPDRSLDAAAQELIVTELYRRGHLSRGKAAHLLGMPLDAFLDHAGRLGIPFVDYTEAEWEEEKRSIQELAASVRPSPMQAP